MFPGAHPGTAHAKDPGGTNKKKTLVWGASGEGGIPAVVFRGGRGWISGLPARRGPKWRIRGSFLRGTKGKGAMILRFAVGALGAEGRSKPGKRGFQCWGPKLGRRVEHSSVLKQNDWGLWEEGSGRFSATGKSGISKPVRRRCRTFRVGGQPGRSRDFSTGFRPRGREKGRGAGMVVFCAGGAPGRGLPTPPVSENAAAICLGFWRAEKAHWSRVFGHSPPASQAGRGRPAHKTGFVCRETAAFVPVALKASFCSWAPWKGGGGGDISAARTNPFWEDVEENKHFPPGGGRGGPANMGGLCWFKRPPQAAPGLADRLRGITVRGGGAAV